ncbi:MAG: DUF1799 domain-containing protein [Magnetococcales bacterium]|nr:DUF1799 domain-containing protein [Magnetococcales bacterium]
MTDTRALASDAAALGVRIDVREREFAVWQENADPARLFFACATQWRLAGMDGIPTGLDYAGVEAAARMSGVALTPELFAGVRIMESAAMDAWAEKRGA